MIQYPIFNCNIFWDYGIRCAPCCFSAGRYNIRSKICDSVADDGYCGWRKIYCVSTYHTPKFRGRCTSGRIVDLLGLLCVRDLEVGETFCITFNCVYHECCVLSWGAVVVIDSMLAAMEVYNLLLSVDGEDVYCIIIWYTIIFRYKYKIQDLVDYIIEYQYIPKVW